MAEVRCLMRLPIPSTTPDSGLDAGYEFLTPVGLSKDVKRFGLRSLQGHLIIIAGC